MSDFARGFDAGYNAARYEMLWDAATPEYRKGWIAGQDELEKSLRIHA